MNSGIGLAPENVPEGRDSECNRHVQSSVHVNGSFEGGEVPAR